MGSDRPVGCENENSLGNMYVRVIYNLLSVQYPELDKIIAESENKDIAEHAKYVKEDLTYEDA